MINDIERKDGWPEMPRTYPVIAFFLFVSASLCSTLNTRLPSYCELINDAEAIVIAKIIGNMESKNKGRLLARVLQVIKGKPNSAYIYLKREMSHGKTIVGKECLVFIRHENCQERFGHQEIGVFSSLFGGLYIAEQVKGDMYIPWRRDNIGAVETAEHITKGYFDDYRLALLEDVVRDIKKRMKLGPKYVLVRANEEQSFLKKNKKHTVAQFDRYVALAKHLIAQKKFRRALKMVEAAISMQGSLKNNQLVIDSRTLEYVLYDLWAWRGKPSKTTRLIESRYNYLANRVEQQKDRNAILIHRFVEIACLFINALKYNVMMDKAKSVHDKAVALLQESGFETELARKKLPPVNGRW